MVLLGKVNGGESEERQVEGVQPDDRSVALVAVIVPVPNGRHDHVTPLQWHLLALDRREALAVNDEPESKSNVPVSGRRLSGVDDLEAAVDGIRGVRRFYDMSDSLNCAGLECGCLRIVGLTSIRTLLSACFSPTISAAL